MRPFAPQPKPERAAPKQLWIVGAAVGLVVLLVAFAAWKLRDRPEDLAHLQPNATSAPSDGTGKIIDRIGGGTITSAADAPTDGASATDTAQGAGQAASPSGSQSSNQASNPAPVSANSGLAQPGRAAFLMEAPEEANKVKTATGSVVWRREMIVSDPNGPPEVAVRADVDIPSLKLQAVLIFQKNTDLSLPASHTIKINFAMAPDAPFTSVRQISVPQMRREDAANGDILGGVPVPITDNAFLIGLSRGSGEANNITLLRDRGWIDVPLMLGNGRIGKLTFEKGAAGQQAMEEAFAAWAQP
ncbi:hypothetical protein [Beijerinckia indica]|uniref:hypothetical protein n=1 Tax=Beijerinckia indica TaxID=533 RepID=UPI000302E43F|nr:hypothetical protein [Beijerinckia indica]